MLVVSQTSPEFAPMFMVLYESIRRFHPDMPIILWTFGGDDIKLPSDIDHRKTNRSTEWIALARPTMMMDALQRSERVLFIGADCELFSPLDRAISATAGSNVALVPHLSRPYTRPLDYPDTEALLYRAGFCNTDFTFLTRTTDTFDFLAWLHDRLNWKCLMDPVSGFNNEQTWMSLAMALFPGMQIWRNHCYNVARWNCRLYNLHRIGDTWFTDEGPLGMFHWSRFNFANPTQFNPLEPSCARGELAEFMAAYAERVARFRVK